MPVQDDDVIIEDSYSAVTIYRDTGEVIRKLHTGTLEECKEVLVEYIRDKGWNHDDLSIINNVSQRHTSYVLKIE